MLFKQEIFLRSMNPKDHHILSHLRQDSRTSLSSISQSIEMPISTIYDKMIKMKKENIITRFTALVDFPKLGYHYHAHVILKIKREQRQDLLTFFSQQPSINSLAEINTGYELFVETIHPTVKEYVEFMDKIKERFEIYDVQEHQVISILEREKFLQQKHS